MAVCSFLLRGSTKYSKDQTPSSPPIKEGSLFLILINDSSTQRRHKCSKKRERAPFIIS
ncbi:hypothetical protein BDA96_05G052600 [Sorghum bicolor]|uniref:Uncharacterized protein n=1 Tax=Sorghum bicolor TaxID=4558 RepID=A0A921QXE7_SORBI|nr:hypothetical protein BDA96_05G052600 [Sorghum bicolor]KAG0528906.1 hypothetical protein BDA96_05G052600 [Sorghum bicolor]KAG0528907.1 hypothetical protein BDA96_05G052600 [Sorghum bicolor]